MLWVKTGTHIIDHERLLAAGAVPRDLYQWGMLYAGKHETDGELPMVAVLASAWGYGGKANIKAAVKLVEVGLWLRTTHGFSICRWAEQGNETKASLEDKRADGRDRKAKSDARRRGNSVTHGVTPHVSNAKGSTSTSLSDSDLGSEIASGLLDRLEPLALDAQQVFDAIDMNRPVGQPTAIVWVAFCGHHAGQHFASREALLGKWQKWVSQQAVYSARDREKDRVRADQEAERKRFAREGPERPPPPTPEQAKRFAEGLSARLLGNRKASP